MYFTHGAWSAYDDISNVLARHPPCSSAYDDDEVRPWLQLVGTGRHTGGVFTSLLRPTQTPVGVPAPSQSYR